MHIAQERHANKLQKMKSSLSFVLNIVLDDMGRYSGDWMRLHSVFTTNRTANDEQFYTADLQLRSLVSIQLNFDVCSCIIYWTWKGKVKGHGVAYLDKWHSWKFWINRL